MNLYVPLIFANPRHQNNRDCANTHGIRDEYPIDLVGTTTVDSRAINSAIINV
jgi:hypothetical protein